MPYLFVIEAARRLRCPAAIMYLILEARDSGSSRNQEHPREAITCQSARNREKTQSFFMTLRR